MELMRSLPDNYFQLAVADPPYGIRDAGGQTGGSGKLKGRVFNNGYIDRWDKAPSQEFFDELMRVSESQIIWGGNYFALPPSRCFVCWDKVQPWENFSQVEFAWTSFDSPAQLFRYDNRTGDKIHPTQKPVALYGWLLQKYGKSGGGNFRPDDGQSVEPHCRLAPWLRLCGLRDRQGVFRPWLRALRPRVQGHQPTAKRQDGGAAVAVLKSPFGATTRDNEHIHEKKEKTERL